MADKTHEGHVLILRVTLLKMTMQEALAFGASFLPPPSHPKAGSVLEKIPGCPDLWTKNLALVH